MTKYKYTVCNYAYYEQEVIIEYELANRTSNCDYYYYDCGMIDVKSNTPKEPSVIIKNALKLKNTSFS
ncbi:hypothetical protein [Methanobacterium ferruginis]|uniref:hypothetical protein n=1 Tax=Methanobacterium ferruginis TaxID=710191 RepID=UPI002573C0D2|nr:hypothetical protein [Methanobacterium ferruginis]BDZ67562.1 hypothetical protein GCM10025860_10100 [Methanobacterium ferruginis]